MGLTHCYKTSVFYILFSTKPVWNTHRTLGMLLHYLEKSKFQIFCRYSAIIPDMEGSANRLHFKCTDFNSSTRLTAYAECIYLFLSKSCSRRWIPCWLMTNTAAMSAVTNLQFHKLIAKVIKWKNSNMENFICNQYGEELAILNTKNIKICGSITKLKATKMQLVCIFLHICWISAEILNFYFPR